MKRLKVCGKRAISSMLAAAMLITVFPFSAAAEEGEEKKDITIQWEQVTQEPSDKAAVTLSAGLSADSEVQSATVNIKLTEEEKSALTTPLPDGFELESWQEETVESDGDDTTTVIESAPEGIPAAGGEGSVSNNGNTTSELPATTAAQPTDYRLSFKLTQGVPITNVTVLTVAEDITIEITDADIEITDATYTEGQKNTAPSFKMEPSPFEFSLPEQEEEPKDEGSEKEEGNGQNGQDTSQQGDDDTKEEEPEKEDEQVLLGDNGSPDEQVIVSVDEGSGSLIVDENSLDDFSFSIQGLSVPTEEHTPNTYAITLTLPEGVIPPADVTANGATITTGESGDVAAFTLNDSESGVTATIDKESLSAEANTLSFTLALAKKQQNPIAAAVNAIAGVFARTDNSDSGVAGTLKFYGNAFSVDYSVLFGAGTSGRSITLSVGEGDNKAIYDITLNPQLPESPTYTFTQADLSPNNQTVIWYDNESTDRPQYNEDGFYPTIKYEIQLGNGGTEVGTLNETTLVKLGFVDKDGEPQWPDIEPIEDGTGFSIDLPKKLYGSEDPYGSKSVYDVTWTFTAPDVAGYSKTESENGETWIYTLLKDFTFTLDVRNGGHKPSEQQVKDLIQAQFTFYQQVGTAGGTTKFPLTEDQIDYNPDTGRVTIHGLPAYSGEGACSYYLTRETKEGEEPSDQLPADGSLLPGGETGQEDETLDYFAISYDNAGNVNANGSTTATYDGGTLRLTLAGETNYSATKVWLDNNAEDRPEAIFYLFRYTEGNLHTDAMQIKEMDVVEDGADKFVSVTYSPDSNTASSDGDEADEDEFEIVFAYNNEQLTLPKYNADGLKYIYVVREDLGEAAGSYEQIFGTVNADGTETLDPLPVDADTDNGNRKSDDTFVYNGGTLTNRLSDTVSASVTKVWEAAAFQADFDDIAVEFELWQQVKAQDGEIDSGYTNTQRQATYADGTPITYVLHNFSAEHLTDSGVVFDLPRYDDQGLELEYYWVESAVYQNAVVASNAPQDAVKEALNGGKKIEPEPANGSDKTFTLTQSDDSDTEQTVTYKSESVVSGNETIITNTIEDNVEFALKKVWEEGLDATDVSFNIYRTPAGTEFDFTKPYVTVKIPDGNPDEENENITISYPNGSSAEKDGVALDQSNNFSDDFNSRNEADMEGEDTDWDAVLQNLPKYDESGHQYQYIVMETDSEGNAAYLPNYENAYYPTTGDYSSVITNASGTGTRIMVQKIWIDDGDLLHREPVTFQAYQANVDGTLTAIQGASVTIDGSTGNWIDYITLPVNTDINAVYVVETTMGGEDGEKFTVDHGHASNTDGNIPTKGEWNEDGYKVGEQEHIFSVSTDNHRYQVTYEKVEDAASVPDNVKALYTVTNRRLGTIDVTVNKEWISGKDETANEGIDTLTEALKTVNSDSTNSNTPIALAFELQFENPLEGWSIGYNTATGSDGSTVSVGGTTPVPIEGETGDSADHIQIILGPGDNENITLEKGPFYFYNLPKYDLSGAVVQYRVDEVWVQKDSTGKWQTIIGGLGSACLSGIDGIEELRTIWNEYTASFTETYVVGTDTQQTAEDEPAGGNAGQTVTRTGETEETENLRDLDKQTVNYKNQRGAVKDVTWYKEWRDTFAYENNNRPDIFLDIYCVVHVEQKDGTVVKQIRKVRENYLWHIQEPNTTETQTMEADIPAVVSAEEATGIALYSADGEPEMMTVSEPVLLEVTETSAPGNETWSVTLSDVQKYDALGYEIEYFAVERTRAHVSDFHYQAVQYAYNESETTGADSTIIGDRDGRLNGVELPDENKKKFDQYTLDLSDEVNFTWEQGSTRPEGIGVFENEGGNTYPQYALLEDGTFINTLASSYTITGQKIWDMNSYLTGDNATNAVLPDVTFNVYQMLKEDADALEKTGDGDIDQLTATQLESGDAEKVAWLTIESEDWSNIRNGTSYRYEINYTGANVVKVGENGEAEFVAAVGNVNAGLLPLYDKATGKNYVYFVREEIELDETAYDDYLKENQPEENRPTADEDKNLYETDVDTVQTGASADVTLTNTYTPPVGALKVKKILSLPANTTVDNGGFPTITFTLSRTYETGEDKQSTPETVDTQKLSYTNYRGAFENAIAAAALVQVVTFEAGTVVFKDLPLYAPNGSKYTYTVTETKLGGYEMKAVDEDISIENVDSAFIINSGATLDDNGNLSIGDLAPVEPTGDEKEPADAQATFYNKFVTENPDTVKLTGTKTWKDYGDAMGTRPDEGWTDNTLTVTTGVDDPLDLKVERKRPDEAIWHEVSDTDYMITYTKDDENSSWKFEITGVGDGLEKWASAGVLWTYRVTEQKNLDGYEEEQITAGGSGNANNTTTSETITLKENLRNSIYNANVNFRKEWKDQNNNTIDTDYLKDLQVTVTFKLQVRNKNTAGAAWQWASDYFDDENLVNSAAKAIEDAVIVRGAAKKGDNYSATITGKINDADRWSGAFVNLPAVVKVNGVITNLEYRVVETTVSYTVNGRTVDQAINPATDDNPYGTFADNGLVTDATYTKDTDGTHVTTNTLSAISITVEKVWNDGNNQYDTRPNAAQNNANGYTWESWFVIQRTTDDPDGVDVTWENVKVIRLYGNNVSDADDDGATGKWSEEVVGLPMIAFDEQDTPTYTYRVRELKPDIENGYNLETPEIDDKIKQNIVEPNTTFYEPTNQNSFDYKAEYEPEKGIVDNSGGSVVVENVMPMKPINGEISVTKKWYDENGDSSAPPNTTVTVQLYQQIGDGQPQPYRDPVELNEYNEWKHIWNGLPAKQGGYDVSYTVKEVESLPDGYIQISTTPNYEDASYTITNVATMLFDVTKVWNNNGVTIPTDEITVGLYRTTVQSEVGSTSGTAVEAVPQNELNPTGDKWTYTLPDGENWSYTFTGLPKYNEEGAPYFYYALELNTDGDPIPDNGSIRYGTQDYHVDYTNPAYEDDGTVVGGETAQTIITNTPSTSLSGEKTWVDNSNEYDTRPENLTLKLERTTDSSTWEKVDIQPNWNTTQGNTWTYTFTNLPMYDKDGKPYTYKVTEDVPGGYKETNGGEGAEANDTDGDGALKGPDFTNTLTGTVDIKGTKTWEGGSGSQPTLTLERRLDGETEWTVVDKQPTWNEDLTQYTYTGLDKYNENGVLYEYRIREDVPNGWDVYYESGTAQNGDNTTGNKNTPVDGLDITNVERGSLTVSKQVTGNRGYYTQQFDFSVTFTLPEGFNNANGWPTISYTKTDAEGKLKTQSAAFVSDTLTIPFTLADDDSITFTNLPGGTTYDVDETNSYGHSPYPENDTGTIPPGGMATAKFVNHRNGGGGGDTPDPDEPDPEIPDEPTPGEDIPPDEPDTPDEPDNPDDPGTDIPDEPTPGEDVPPDEPGTDIPDEPTPGGDVPPDDPNTPDQPGKPGLPQTGQLWWPVLLLAAVGAVMSLVGLWNIKRYRGKHGKNKV